MTVSNFDPDVWPTPTTDWEWCGQAHHFIAGHSCRFHMATWVADGRFLVSTVGDYRPDRDAKTKTMTTIGAGDDSFFETYVFTTDPDNRDPESGHPPVTDWSEVVGERWATHEQANEGHMRYCREYDGMTPP